MSATLKFAENLANLLDNNFKIGNFGFGLDAVIDLLPIGGDTLILILSLLIVAIALQQKVPRPQIFQMLGNVFFAFIIGLIPIIGSLAYLAFRPNMRNLAILQKYTSL